MEHIDQTRRGRPVSSPLSLWTVIAAATRPSIPTANTETATTLNAPSPSSGSPHMPMARSPTNWLVDWPGADRGKKGAIKWGVLTELGRLSEARIEAKMIVALAHVVSQERLTVKDAEQRLRNWRLTKIASSPTS